MNILKKRMNTHYKALILGSVFVCIVWLISGISLYFSLDNWSERGTFGDMFGAINALFSGLAFAGLIFTIIMQREEIKTNQDEIELNRQELHKSVRAQQKTQQALQDQAKQTALTARINAMSTVINYYNTQITNPNNSEELIQKARVKRRALIKKIDDMIDVLDDSDVD
jgi:septal ring factor EnvC (AmiA/AmiB activator)